MDKLEIVGLIAAIFIAFSMIFKTTTFKGTILMRSMNTVGSIFFIIYGFMLPAYSTAICNVFIFVLNIYYLFKEVRDYKKGLNNESINIK